MRTSRVVGAALASGFLTIAAAGCGGGGRGGPYLNASPLVVSAGVIDPGAPGVNPADVGDDTGESLLQTKDAQGNVISDTRIPIGISGGWGGPYVIKWIGGDVLPLGVSIDDGVEPGTGTDPQTNPGVHQHHFSGVLRQSGTFDFTIEVQDVGGEPFYSETANLTWQIGVGPVRIVASDPAWAAPGALDEVAPTGPGHADNPLYPALRTTVFNQFVSHNLLVAGGQPPYSCQIVDDPAIANDGQAPRYVDFAAGSTTLLGTPIEVSGDGIYYLTVEATDAAGAKGRLTLQWRIDVPPMILLTTDLVDGQCGVPYTDTISIANGVPPFAFELVKEDVDRIGGVPTWNPPAAPTPPDCTAKMGVAPYDAPYPLATDPGPDFTSFRVLPEGVMLGDVDNPYVPPGSISGTPRREGDFRVVLHAQSKLLPNFLGQQVWRAYDVHFDPCVPLAQDPAYTVEDVFASSQPYSTIPEAEVTVIYNPDSATHGAPGLQFLATGGVKQDGLTDAPHGSQVSPAVGETAGAYGWSDNWNPAGDGDAYVSMPTNMEFTSTGVLRVVTPPGPNALVRQGAQAVEVSVTSARLPAELPVTQRVNFSVGPDRVVITESSTSDTTLNYGYWSSNDGAMRLRVVEPYSSGSAVRDLASTDLSANTTIPATTGLAGTLDQQVKQLLSAWSSTTNQTPSSSRVFDLLRVCVNPSGWWNDNIGINASGARPQQHADVVRGYNYFGDGYGYANSNGSYGWMANATCVELPSYTNTGGHVPAPVAHAPSNGIYTDGGQLYCFTSSQYFGVFVVRRDGTVYVPCAFNRTSQLGSAPLNFTVTGFGDNWQTGYAVGQNPYLEMPTMAVSPDGRFATMKLQRSVGYGDGAGSTAIVVFSLTGERPFGGNSYKILATGSSGGATTGGVYFVGESMVLTNRHLYYMCVNTQTHYDVCWNGHYFYRYEITNSTGTVTAGASAGALLPRNGSVAAADWPLATNVPMQSPYHWYQAPSGSADAFGMDAMNVLPMGMARMPYRVSRNGKAIAILAGAVPTNGYSVGGVYTNSDVNVWANHVWVDYDGGGVRKLSTVRRRTPLAAGRTGLISGPYSSNYSAWGRNTGPQTGLEIADDGLAVAHVVNRHPVTSSVSYSSSSYTSSIFYSYREDVIAYKTSNAWASATEIQVTGADSGVGTFSTAGGILWRFGALAFTRQGQGLVFWGGAGCFYANQASYYYLDSCTLAGSLYACDLSTATGAGSPTGTAGVNVYSILAAGDGGNQATTTVPGGPYSAGSPYNPATAQNSASASSTYGVIKPYLGFYSTSGDFYYLVNLGSVSSSDYANWRLVAVNVRSTNALLSINGHADFRAFLVEDWPTQRGFVGGYTYPYHSIYDLNGSGYYSYTYRAYYGIVTGAMGGLQVTARRGDQVFFASHWQYSSSNGSTSAGYGGPIYTSGNYDYNSFLGHVYTFNADVAGPIQRVTGYGPGGTGWAETGSTTYRPIQYVFPSPDGKSCAFIMNSYASTVNHREQENLFVSSDTALDPTGDLLVAPSQHAVTGATRVCTSMSFSSDGSKLFYAAGTTNENNKTLYQVSLRPDPVTGTLPSSQAVLGNYPRWFEVLHSGR